MNDVIRRKIEALIRLSNDPGATEGEKSNAKERASFLFNKYSEGESIDEVLEKAAPEPWYGSVWITAFWREIPYTELESSHIVNILNLFGRTSPRGKKYALTMKPRLCGVMVEALKRGIRGPVNDFSGWLQAYIELTGDITDYSPRPERLGATSS